MINEDHDLGLGRLVGTRHQANAIGLKAVSAMATRAAGRLALDKDRASRRPAFIRSYMHNFIAFMTADQGAASYARAGTALKETSENMQIRCHVPALEMKPQANRSYFLKNTACRANGGIPIT